LAECAQHAEKMMNLVSKSDNKRTILNLALALFKTSPRQMSICTLLLFLSGLMEAMGILMILPIISITLDQTSENQDIFTRQLSNFLETFQIPLNLELALVFVAVIIFLKAVFLFISQEYNARVISRFVSKMRNDLLKSVVRSTWEYFSIRSTARIVNALTLESTYILNVYTSLLQLLSLFLLSTIYLLIAIFSSPQVFVFALVVGGAIFLAIRKVIRHTNSLSGRFIKASETLNDQLINNLNIFKPLKAMGLHENTIPFLKKSVDQLEETTYKLALSSNFTTLIQEPIIIIFLCLGIYLIDSFTTIDANFLIFSTVLYYRIVTRIGEMQSRFQKLSGAQHNYWTVSELIQESQQNQEELKCSNTQDLYFKEKINIEDLHFSFLENPVIQSLDVEIPFGKIVSIMGPSGSGKTTFVDILMGLYRPRSGKILVDGHDFFSLDLMAWRRSIGFVPQDSILANDSIYNNVALFDQSITRDKVAATLKSVQAWDFVAAKPEGLDFIVGENGVKLSGGQKQRLSIARALVRNPRLLILDEPTSAMDAKTSAQVCEMLKSLSGRMSILIITHQRDIESISDYTYMLSHGKLIPTCHAKDHYDPVLI